MRTEVSKLLSGWTPSPVQRGRFLVYCAWLFNRGPGDRKERLREARPSLALRTRGGISVPSVPVLRERRPTNGAECRSPGPCLARPESRTPSPEPETEVPVPILMDSERVGRTLTRIAHEIVERNRASRTWRWSASARRGVPLARRLAAILREITGVEVADGHPRHHPLPRRPDEGRGRAAADRRAGPRSRSPSTAGTSCSSTTCSTPAGRSAPRSTRSSTSAGRARSSSPCWSIAATASCRSRPTTSARTCRHRRRETIHVRLAEIDGVDEVTLDQVEGEPA